jgi:hypothetical protein
VRSGPVGLLLLTLFVVTSHVAFAQPQRPVVLEVDRCPHNEADEAELRRQGQEHYSRGLTLYLQGDYKGAVVEFAASYCKIPSISYTILKDVGQAYERDLNYEMAVAYFERFVREMPENAVRANACAPDPKDDRELIRRRVQVLKDLKAHVLIQTVPGKAGITIERKDNGAVVKRGVSGDTFELIAGQYVIKTDLRGYEPSQKTITPRIGKPENHLMPLTPQTGTLSVQVSPADAKIYLFDGAVDRFVGWGKYEMKLDAKKYTVRAEKEGRIEVSKKVEVKPDLVTQVPMELTPARQFGRRQLIAYSTIAGTFAAGGLLNAFGNTGITTGGTLAGGAAGAVFSYLYLPDNLSLGTSNLTITASIAGLVAGTAGALVFTDNTNIVAPVGGAALVAGAAAGYYFGEATKVRPGDAALINTAMTWGVVSGFLFAESFVPKRDLGRQVYAGLVLSGFGMGAVSGSIMTRYFDISRTHAALLDVGAVIGILGGLALEGLIYGGNREEGSDFTDAEREHIANFSLGGMAVGLLGAGILTRNMDAPKLPIQPTLGTAISPGGKTTTTYGFGGTF